MRDKCRDDISQGGRDVAGVTAKRLCKNRFEDIGLQQIVLDLVEPPSEPLDDAYLSALSVLLLAPAVLVGFLVRSVVPVFDHHNWARPADRIAESVQRTGCPRGPDVYEWAASQRKVHPSAEEDCFVTDQVALAQKRDCAGPRIRRTIG